MNSTLALAGQSPANNTPMVSPRAARFPNLIGAPLDMHTRLDRLRAVVIGAGSIGRGIAIDLGRLGIASVQIVDPGRFKDTSHWTHPHLRPGEALGDSKALAAANLVRTYSPRTKVTHHVVSIESLPLMAMADADLVFLATDNIRAEVETGQRCMRLGIPLIHASVDGSMLIAQVRFFASRGNGSPSPCPACRLSETEWEMLDREVRFSCEPGTTQGTAPAVQTIPTMSVSSLCSIAANLAMMQLLKSMLELGPSPDDSFLEYCGFTHKTVISPLSYQPSCPFDHGVFRRIRINRAKFSQCSLAEFIAAAGLSPETRGASIQLGDDLRFCETTLCRCGKASHVCRFFRSLRPVVGNCTCGSELKATAFNSYRAVPISLLASLPDAPLSELGAETAEWAIIRTDEQGQLLHCAENSGGNGGTTPCH